MTAVPSHLVSDAVSQREMREGRKPIGHGVVHDPDCFYNGREIVVWDSTAFPNTTVMTVSLPSGTGSGRIEFALREDRLKDFVRYDEKA